MTLINWYRKFQKEIRSKDNETLKTLLHEQSEIIKMLSEEVSRLDAENQTLKELCKENLDISKKLIKRTKTSMN